MRSKTINLFESIQQNSITNIIDKVAEQFKSEIIEEYKASETKEMSTELENKITKALALEGVDSPEDWVADVCSVALDMTPTGEALAIKEDENTDIKGQLKQLGIKSIYVSDEHKRADEDELNKLGGLEYNYRLQRNPSKAHYYSYLSINHETLGDIYISFDIKTNKIDTTGFPWNFIKEATTPEIKEFVETNEEFFNNLLKSKKLGTGINLNESLDIKRFETCDNCGSQIPVYSDGTIGGGETPDGLFCDKCIDDADWMNIDPENPELDREMNVNFLINDFMNRFLPEKGLTGKDVTRDLMNEYFTEVFEDKLETEEEMNAMNDAEDWLEHHFGLDQVEEYDDGDTNWEAEHEAEAIERMENRYGMKESADLKESDGPFSGVEFEKNVPHEMRFKEYNFVNINDLYWVTQQPFSLNQLNQFAEAFKNTKFSKAYVTVRDFSTYDFENDLSRNVFAIIDKYNDIIDPTGYVEAVKKEGWEKILEESEDIINEA